MRAGRVVGVLTAVVLAATAAGIGGAATASELEGGRADPAIRATRARFAPAGRA